MRKRTNNASPESCISPIMKHIHLTGVTKGCPLEDRGAYPLTGWDEPHHPVDCDSWYINVLYIRYLIQHIQRPPSVSLASFLHSQAAALALGASRLGERALSKRRTVLTLDSSSLERTVLWERENTDRCKSLGKTNCLKSVLLCSSCCFQPQKANNNGWRHGMGMADLRE